MRYTISLTLLTATVLVSGCLSHAILNERREKVVQAAKFDSDCNQMRVVEQQDDERYKLEGCGLVYIYSCHDRHLWTGDGAYDVTQLMLAGNIDSDAPCHLVRHYPNPQTL